MRRTVVAVLSLFLLLGACADDPSGPTREFQDAAGSASSGETIFGWVRGPNGMDLCTAYPAETRLRVSIYDVSVSPAALEGGQDVTCPSDTYSIAVAPGTYVVVFRSLGPDNGVDPRLNNVQVDTAAITVGVGAQVKNNITVNRGQPVTGGAQLDGGPFPGNNLTLWLNAAGSRIFLTTINSASDGSWVQHGQPVHFQKGIEIDYLCAEPLGTRAAGPNARTFRYIVNGETMSCEYGSGSVAGAVWTHRATELWTTAWPGFFDTHSTYTPWNAGWGVQFPVGPGGGSHAQSASHLFHGGLVISTGTEIMSGASLGGYGFECGAECHYDFGETQVGVEVNPDGTRRVNFEYVDNGLTPGADLWVRQSSWDGDAGFTLFRYVIRNDGAEPITLNPGLFMDWDLGTSANTVDSERQGRLMYTVAPDKPFMGTLIIGRNAVGNFGRVNSPSSLYMSLQNQVDAMSGALRAPSVTGNDVHYFHGASAATIQPGRYTTLWVAIVAGNTLTQLRGNANRAEDYVDDIEAMMTLRPEGEDGAPLEPLGLRSAPVLPWTKATLGL